MNRWLKRILFLILLILWLFLISLPYFAFRLAARDQLEVGSPENHVRIFLLQDADAEGIGLERTRPQRVDSLQCSETSVRYFMWVGEPENVIYCQCQDATGAALTATNGRCRIP